MRFELGADLHDDIAEVKKLQGKGALTGLGDSDLAGSSPRVTEVSSCGR